MEKSSTGKRDRSAILNREDKESLTEKLAFEKRLEVGEGGVEVGERVQAFGDTGTASRKAQRQKHAC